MKRLRAVALAAVGLVLAAALLEGTLDGLDPLRVSRLHDFRALMHASQRDGGGLLRLAPGAALALGEGSFEIHANALGLRGPLPSAATGAGRPFRIVCIGDGAVFGWGVDDELTAVRRVERALRDASPARPVEVVNLAHPGYAHRDLEAALRVASGALQADLALVFDRGAAAGLSPELRAIRDGREPAIPWWGRRMPNVYDLVTGAPARARQGPPEPLRPVGEVAALLREAADQGLRTAFVTFGARAPGQAETACEAVGVPCFDADPRRAGRGRPVLVDPANGFPDAAGHAAIAEALRAALRALGPLERH
ncbi:MAG: hypothetical protein IPM29_19350 [Planctomycetes bacterium]|nr:hypothetical protein [Planctomycetota bacterium]